MISWSARVVAAIGVIRDEIHQLWGLPSYWGLEARTVEKGTRMYAA
jgi:hypothetical protein